MEGDIIHSMEDVLVKKYGVDLLHKADNRMVTDWWNWMQREVGLGTLQIELHILPVTVVVVVIVLSK